jgi:hypothetical protein
MDPIEITKHRGYTIKIFQDEDPESPREWDNLGKMVCFHRRYDLGDKHSMEVDDLKELVTRKDVTALPLYLLDHSGLWMRTSGFGDVDPHGWDWGQVGYVYADDDMIRKEFGAKRVTPALRAKVKKLLEGEVETYNKYLSGEVLGFVIEGPDGEMVDSCWGHYDTVDELLKELKANVDKMPHQLELPTPQPTVKRSPARRSRSKKVASTGLRGIRG